MANCINGIQMSGCIQRSSWLVKQVSKQAGKQVCNQTNEQINKIMVMCLKDSVMDLYGESDAQLADNRKDFRWLYIVLALTFVSCRWCMPRYHRADVHDKTCRPSYDRPDSRHHDWWYDQGRPGSDYRLDSAAYLASDCRVYGSCQARLSGDCNMDTQATIIMNMIINDTVGLLC